MDSQKRQNHLKEDMGQEANAYRDLLQKLDTWQAPHPTPAETTQLLTQLQPELPAISLPHRLHTTLTNHWLWLLSQTQMKIVKQELWIASLLIMSLGILVALITYTPTSNAGISFVLIAPLVSALGIAFLYGTTHEPALELELTLPTSPRLLLLVRLFLVFAFDLCVALLGSGLLAWFLPDLSWWGLVTTWLAPMTFLSAFAFWVSIAVDSVEFGVIMSMGLWGIQVMRFLTTDVMGWLGAIPNFLFGEMQPLLWLSALLLGAWGIWLAGREEQQLGSLA